MPIRSRRLVFLLNRVRRRTVAASASKLTLLLVVSVVGDAASIRRRLTNRMKIAAVAV